MRRGCAGGGCAGCARVVRGLCVGLGSGCACARAVWCQSLVRVRWHKALGCAVSTVSALHKAFALSMFFSVYLSEGSASAAGPCRGSEAWRLGGLEAFRLGGSEAWRLGGLGAWGLGRKEEKGAGSREEGEEDEEEEGGGGRRREEDEGGGGAAGAPWELLDASWELLRFLVASLGGRGAV